MRISDWMSDVCSSDLHATDYAVLLRMERGGLVSVQSFDLAAADPAVQRGLTRAAADAHARILNRRKGLDLARNGWVALGNALGVYGNDYQQRAFIAYAGLGALPPEEDRKSTRLNSSH